MELEERERQTRGGDGDGAAAAASGASAEQPVPRRLPWRFTTALLVNNFAQAVMLTLPFTLATYMVRDFLAAPSSSSSSSPSAAVDERRVGELTGLLTAAYSLSQAVTSIPWGKWSDAKGRRPVLLLACAASSLSIAAFGFAGALFPAILARVLGGLLNQFIGAWKTSLAEATAGDEGEQARVMALMGLSWGLGCVLGPATGGLLARPCGAEGGGGGWALPWLCGNGGLLAARPYALPCLVVSLVCAGAGAMTFFWLPETLGLGSDGLLLLPSSSGGGGGGGQQAPQPLASGAAAEGTRAVPCSDTSPLLRRCDQQTAADPSALRRVVVVGAGATAGRERNDEDDDEQHGPGLLLQHRRVTGGSNGGGRAGSKGGALELQPTPSFSKFKRLPYDAGALGDDDEGDDGDEEERGAAFPPPGRAAIPPHASSPPPPPPAKTTTTTTPTSPPPPLSSSSSPPASWNHPAVRHALAGYGLICLHFIALEELVPLWASAPFAAGGLARAPAQLAFPLALNGAALVLFAALAYPPLRARYGTVPLLRWGAALGAAVAALMPLPSLPALLLLERTPGKTTTTTAPLPPHAPLPAAALALWLALMSIKAAAQAAAFTGAMIRVNVVGRRACGADLGSVNGVGQTLASLARGLGPAAAGIAWGFSVYLRGRLSPASAGGGGGGWLGPLSQFAPFFAVAGVAVLIYWWFGREGDEE